MCPVVPLLPRLVPTDRALVVGPGAEACAFLLAAHDVDVVFWASDLGVVERMEQRAATESLATRCFAQMVQFGYWLPPCTAPFDLVVVDLGALAELDSPTRFDALRALQAQTHAHGSTCCCPRPPWYPRRSSRSTTAGNAKKPPAGSVDRAPPGASW